MTSEQRTARTDYIAYLCGRSLFLPPAYWYPYFNQINALERVLEDAASSCALTVDVLDAKRGLLLASMTRNKAVIDRLTGASASQSDEFCSAVKQSGRVTKPLLVEALSKSGLIEKGDREAVSFGLGLMISHCSGLIDLL